MRDFISRTAVPLFDGTQDGSSVPAKVHAVRACRRRQARGGRTSPRTAADTRARRPFLAKSACFVMIVFALFASPTSAVHANFVSNLKRANASAIDPFATFIAEASQRFGISAHWIRAVMRVESAGCRHTVSPKGAMGLMQIMPETWTELRTRYGLDDDPYDARNNILAGAAYLRGLHDRYGAPGFLAAYNAGPGRYERHLATGRPLPAETRDYVAKLEPMLNSNGASRRSTVALGTPSWRQATIFIAHGNGSPAPSRTPSRRAAGSRIERSCRRRSFGACAAIDRPVCASSERGSVQMTGIALSRILSWAAACSVVGQVVDGSTIHGRQGKSAAFVRAHVVGWICAFCRPATHLRWRLGHFSQRFHGSRRHRRISNEYSR